MILSGLTKTPCLSLHLKYFTPLTVPLCLPGIGRGGERDVKGSGKMQATACITTLKTIFEQISTEETWKKLFVFIQVAGGYCSKLELIDVEKTIFKGKVLKDEILLNM